MVVNGLQLPASYAEFFEEQRYTSWDQKGSADAFGNPLMGADFMPLGSVEWIEQKTGELAEYCGPIPEEPAGDLGTSFLFDIDDFSKIVCFGRTAGGAPFCFDFRENAGEPSVIFWDDLYAHWRRIAPNFDAFISLFERFEGEEEEG